MKYKIKTASKRDAPISRQTGKIYKAKRGRLPSPYRSVKAKNERERIRFSSLFEYASLEGEELKKIRKRLRRERTRKAFLGLLGALWWVITLPLLPIRRWLSRKREGLSTKMLLGGLLATVSVSAIALFSVLAILFLPYFGRYTKITVPEYVGKNYEDAAAAYPHYDYVIDYEYSELYEAGSVINQTPSAGVTRRSYGRDGSFVIALTVSRGRQYHTLPDLCGMNSREAILELKNEGIGTEIHYEYSDSHEKSTVISTAPMEGTRLYSDDTVSLYISLGRQINYVSLPNLVGLYESAAQAKLESAGLVLGKVKYESSRLAAGTVIAQSPAPFTELAEGESVSVTVSAGSAFAPHTLPDLYGMTADEAREALSAVGLTLGGIYSVSSALPKGRIVSQTPIQGTSITPDILKVDIFISS